jgi:hypothetical protein
MKNLYDGVSVAELKTRASRLNAESHGRWGKMSAAQALAHCAVAMEMAVGDQKLPRMFIGRLIGGVAKRSNLKDDAPMSRDAPTMKELVVLDQRDLEEERVRLCLLIDRFAGAGPEGCTTHPHSFFGPMAPEEWALLMYKHIDHHLRQFGA